MSETVRRNEPSAPAAPQPSARAPRTSGPVHRLRRYVYRKWPWLTRDPDEKERLQHWWERDRAENDETAPPADELVDLHCMWAMEFYTPAHIESLLNGFARLGWDKDDSLLSGRSPAQWVRQARESSQGGAWFNLGLIVPPGNKKYISPKRTAPLPPNVDHAVGEVFCLTSSLTCLVIGFFLDDVTSRRFDAALRQERRTTSRPIGRGHTILRPRHQKEAAIRAVRAELRAAGGNWFRAHLAGIFAGGMLGGEFPTCEFVTLRRGRPFPRRQEGSAKPEEYLRILGMAHDFDAWEWGRLSGFKFAWPLFPGTEGRFHSILAANEDDFDAQVLQGYGGRQRSAYQGYVDSHLKGPLSRWSLLALLSAFDRHLNAVRDSATFQPPNRRRAFDVLDAVGNLISKGADIAAVSAELSRFANEKASFLYEVETFKPAHPEHYRDNDATLGDVLRRHVGERALSLERAERSVRDLLTQYGAILGARDNIKLQGIIGRLTWLLVALTIVILVLTAVMAIF